MALPQAGRVPEKKQPEVVTTGLAKKREESLEIFFKGMCSLLWLGAYRTFALTTNKKLMFCLFLQ